MKKQPHTKTMHHYEEYSFENDLLYIRPVLIFSGVLYAGFGLLDFIFYPENLSLFLIIRFLIVIPIILGGYMFTYHPQFRKLYHYILTVLMFVSGTGIIVMIYSIEGVNHYYSGLSLVIIIGFLLLKIKTLFAAVSGAMLILLFLVIGLFISDFSVGVILLNALFYVAFLLIGTIGSIYTEHNRRKKYLKEMNIVQEKIVLEKRIYNQYESIKNFHSETIYSLATLAESRDRLAGNHIRRVGELSERLAKELPSSMYKNEGIQKDNFITTISLASILHDIGKIAISDLILNKEDSLTKEEFEIIKTHTTIGSNMLQSIKDDYGENAFIAMGIDISKSHHEHWDEHGYPEGLGSRDIPLAARLVGIIDVFDALISKRPYKEAFSKEKSLNIIRKGIGTHFDPEIGQIFIDLATKSNDPLFGQ